METLIAICKTLGLITIIAVLSVILYATIAGFIKTIIDGFKRRKAVKELDKDLDELAEIFKEIIEENLKEEENNKKSVKKVSKKKKNE